MEKVLFVCGWCLTREDYVDYPGVWEYYNYIDVSLERAAKDIQEKVANGEYTYVIGHSVGCAVIHQANVYKLTKVIYISPCIAQVPRLTLLYRLHWLCPMFVYKFLEHRLGNLRISASKLLLDGRYPVITQLISLSYMKGSVSGDCTIVQCRKDIIPKCYVKGATIRLLEGKHLPTWQKLEEVLWVQ